jgi:hypothetical protein
MARLFAFTNTTSQVFDGREFSRSDSGTNRTMRLALVWISGNPNPDYLVAFFAVINRPLSDLPLYGIFFRQIILAFSRLDFIPASLPIFLRVCANLFGVAMVIGLAFGTTTLFTYSGKSILMSFVRSKIGKLFRLLALTTRLEHLFSKEKALRIAGKRDTKGRFDCIRKSFACPNNFDCLYFTIGATL